MMKKPKTWIIFRIYEFKAFFFLESRLIGIHKMAMFCSNEKTQTVFFEYNQTKLCVVIKDIPGREKV